MKKELNISGCTTKLWRGFLFLKPMKDRTLLLLLCSTKAWFQSARLELQKWLDPHEVSLLARAQNSLPASLQRSLTSPPKQSECTVHVAGEAVGGKVFSLLYLRLQCHMEESSSGKQWRSFFLFLYSSTLYKGDGMMALGFWNASKVTVMIVAVWKGGIT